MTKTIGIDARMWAHPGIGRYLRELSRALLRIAPAGRFLFFGDESLIRPFLGADVSVVPAAAPIYGWAEQRLMARLSRRVDLLHVPHFNVPLFHRTALAATVHDLIYVRDRRSMPNPLGRAYVRMLLGHVARRAGVVLTVSEATKADWLELFPRCDASRIVVTPEAASDLFRPVPAGPGRAALLAKLGLDRPFVLFVGSLKPHKNASLLIRAVRRLREESGMDVQAVLVGRADPKYPQILREIREAPDAVRYLGELPDEHLVHLYNAARAFVLPSFCEGFGLPVLEAMACATPVLLSRRSSLPEIGGDAGQYFDPERVDALCELLYTIFKNQDLRQKLSALCVQRAAQFTWERTARRTLAAYDQVLS